jgi:hypothetical protein
VNLREAQRLIKKLYYALREEKTLALLRRDAWLCVSTKEILSFFKERVRERFNKKMI